ncbi:uncharacterized protein LOC111315667 isoform X2 [Durio zibethinus]|uniref:Uncharacterized protein LOC111315667 isoform X2 n=1 Tax=Durio zibethinus TaxID=66656 RepID=A0A6P6B8X3_DURZI|nr:uncharacterized protein LOC111315667 isoform X2 [Durio zibethinus]
MEKIAGCKMKRILMQVKSDSESKSPNQPTMDPSSYVRKHQHHHNNNPRYVPFSPPLHPCPPPSHPPSPCQHSPKNLYPSRHHLPPPQPPPQLRPLPSPPPPLPPQQQSYFPLPVPPPPLSRQQHHNHQPYSPHHPQYTFNPNFNSKPKPSPNPNPTYVSLQIQDFPQRRVPEFGTRSDCWPDNRVSRPHPVSNLDREAHYHQVDRRTACPEIERFRHDLEGSSRFRDFELNQREREELCRFHSDRWISDKSTRDFGIVSMRFESNSSLDHEVNENVRWGSRLRDRLIDNGNDEINERDEMRVFSRKNDYDYDYDAEKERFNERGSIREISHEFNRTPRKHIQKKSSLLRIQNAKLNHRSREDERSHYLGYYNEGKTGTLRGKDLVLSSDHGMEEKEREDSPVELDVSFKSNSLVAKAIVTPTSFAHISDSNLVPKNIKFGKVTRFDKDSSSLQTGKANESSAKLYGSTYVVNRGSGSEDSKQSEGKVKSSGTGNVQDGIKKPCSKGTNVSLRKGKFKKPHKATVKLDDLSCITRDASISDKKPEPLKGKATIPCIGNMGDGGAQNCSNRANFSVGENKVEGTLKSTVSDKIGASVGKSSILKTTKKKIIVRKVVKKVTNSPLILANSELAKKGDQPVKADTPTCCLSPTTVSDRSVTPLKMEIASVAGDSVHGVDSDCCPKESVLLLENEKVNGASRDISRDVGTDVDPDSSVAPKIKNSSTHPFSSSGHEETKVDQGYFNADNSVVGPHIISNTKEDRTEKPNETIKSGTLIVEDLNKQFYHNESSINHGLSRSDNIKMHGDIVDIYSSVPMYNSTGFDCDSSNTQEINTACDIGNFNSGCKQVCTTSGGPIVEDGTTEGLEEANCLVGSNKITHLPCEEETLINSGSIYADSSIQNRSTIGSPDIGYVNSGERNREVGDGFVKHLSPSTLSPGNSDTEGIPDAMESIECGDEYAASIHKRKVGISELDLSSSTFTDISLGSANVFTSANCLDGTISTSGIDCNPAEAISGIGWPDVGLRHSRDKVSILQGSSLDDTFPEVSASADGKSPEKKKRKISTSGSSLTGPVISQEVAVSDISKSSLQLPSNFTDDLLQLEQEVKVSSTDGLHTKGIALSCVNNSVAGPSQAVGTFSYACRDDHPSIYACPAFIESVAPSSPCLYPLKLGGEQLSGETSVSAVNNHLIDATDIEGDNGGKVHEDTAEDQKIISSEVTQCRIIPEHKSSSSDQRFPRTDVEDDNHLPLKDDFPSASNSLVFGVDTNEVSAAYSNDEVVMPAPDIPYDVGFPINHDNLVISKLTCKAHLCQNSEEKAFSDEKHSDDKPMIEGDCSSSALVSYSHHSKTILKSNDAIQTNQLVAGKAGLLPSHDSKNTNSPNFLSGETHGRKNQLSHVVPKSYPTCSSLVCCASKSTTSSTNITKPQTWQQTDNSSAYPLSGNKPSLIANPLRRQMPKKALHFQSTSYIRKGNSLVRTSISVPFLPQGSHSLNSSDYRLNSGVVDEVKKGTGPKSRADAVDLRIGGVNTSFERPTTPPLSNVTKIPKQTINSSGECTSSPLAEPSIGDCCETTTKHPSSMENNDVLNFPEEGLNTSETVNRNGSVNNLEDWTEQNESDLVPSNAKRVTYVKPKSNQLVAISDCGRNSILDADKNQPFSASSDGYYKKRKNQLIRTSLESHIKQAVTISDGKSNSVGQVAAKVISSRTFGKRRSNKVVAKTNKLSKFSLVCTLHGARLSNNDGISLCHPKVLPQLFSWKRMTNKRSFKLNSVSSCSSSLSTIGLKMLLLRKRNTVYTRSINGFSLQKTKVLSVGSSSLKWSKSIERHSRKANEEATLAVVEAERKKREQNGGVSGTGKRSHSRCKVVHGTELRPGERIFRIGSLRYKMDSSRRSLQRISDKSSCSAGHLSENITKISYVPRRLLIGNDEYVRIGNGNQLVRDLKKRTCVLASEKVWWSLHTARLRLVKKRKYCQFFTRFGKCNKDNGKCPYIHDPSKIAVCTKFLKGLCSNPNCKLTHKVIPERMPDCSYFLQGLCTNENCPYRHVHVNPNASTCQGFLRGYCADDNECRKKHSYICPKFEATGSCPQGSKCKLHHPKNRIKGKKSKRSIEHKNACGRYFRIDISEPKRIVSEKHKALDDGNIFFDGKFSDYISLDVGDDEAGELHKVICDQTTFGDNDSSDLQLDNLNESIKPIRIMNEYKMTQSLLVSEASSVKHVAIR